MVCVYCRNNTVVANSRGRTKDNEIWRRRKCSTCLTVFSTTEKIDYFSCFKVKKATGQLEDFSESKIFISIYRSIDHLPNSPTTATHLCKTALRGILRNGNAPLNPVINSSDIEQSVFYVLQKYDSAGAIKYKSYKNNLSAAKDIKQIL